MASSADDTDRLERPSNLLEASLLQENHGPSNLVAILAAHTTHRLPVAATFVPESDRAMIPATERGQLSDSPEARKSIPA